MAERRPIFSTTGDHIGYTEGDAAFDLFDRQRCIYNAATGNLSDSTTGKLVGYVSFAHNFVVPSRIAAELFGQPGEADADLSNMVELPSPSSSEDSRPAAAENLRLRLASQRPRVRRCLMAIRRRPALILPAICTRPIRPNPPSRRMILNYWSARSG